MPSIPAYARWSQWTWLESGNSSPCGTLVGGRADFKGVERRGGGGGGGGVGCGTKVCPCARETPKEGIVFLCVCCIQPVVLRKHTGRERKSAVFEGTRRGERAPMAGRGTKLIMSRDDRGRNGPAETKSCVEGS